MKFRSTKTYTNDLGLSCCFRQWRAESHCNKLHGYAIGVYLEFEADYLDKNNWVYDFGDCKWIKQFLIDTFDHKTIIAKDDPEKDLFIMLNEKGVIDLVLVDHVGCEMFSSMVFNKVSPMIAEKTNGRVRLIKCEVFEHGSNSAMVYSHD